MTSSNPETELRVASWRSEAALDLLENADDWLKRAKLRDAVTEHIEAEPNAVYDDDFLNFLAQAHSAFMTRGEYEEALGYGLHIDKMGRPDVAWPLMRESAYLLAQEEFTKAQQALKDDNFRRAADKGVWATAHFSDAMYAGKTDTEDEFYAAAAVAFEGNAYYLGPVDAIEEPIFRSCDRRGIPRPVELLTAIRLRVYNETLSDTDRLRPFALLWHAQALDKLGAGRPALSRQAGVIGVRAYLNGQWDCFPNEFLDELEVNDFSPEILADLHLAVLRRRYEMDYERAHDPSSHNDIAIFPWYAVAHDCVMLIKSGDEIGQDKLRFALQKQAETIDEDFFTFGYEDGLDTHFDDYVRAGFISDDESKTMKQALKERLGIIRREFAEKYSHCNEDDEQYKDEVLQRIDKAIAEYT